jgi:hypothetical protein
MKLTHGRLKWGIDGPSNVTSQSVKPASQFSIEQNGDHRRELICLTRHSLAIAAKADPLSSIELFSYLFFDAYFRSPYEQNFGQGLRKVQFGTTPAPINYPQFFFIKKISHLEYHEPAVTERVPDSWCVSLHVPVGPRRRPKVERLVGRANGRITCDGQRERAVREIPIPTRNGTLEMLWRGTTREGRGIEERGEIRRRHIRHEPRDRFRASESGSVAF